MSTVTKLLKVQHIVFNCYPPKSNEISLFFRLDEAVGGDDDFVDKKGK